MNTPQKGFLKTYEVNLRKANLDKATISDMFKRQVELLKGIDKETMPARYTHEEAVLEVIKRVNSDTF